MSKELGNVLRMLRRRYVLTQQQVADEMHVDRATYTYWEIGKTEPSIENLGKLARLFNVSPSLFFQQDSAGKSFEAKINYDRVRAMSLEEMSELLCEDKCVIVGKNNKDCDGLCKLCMKRWLKEEIEEKTLKG